jgi:ferredoxin-type protein NapH
MMGTGGPGRFRVVSQTASLVLGNLYFKGWADGSIYPGRSKMFCIPGLHCYSCPSSVLACPVGSLQNILATNGFLGGITSGRADSLIVLGVVGFLLALGFLAGRIACAWVCPFGLLQELLYRVHSRKLTVPAPWRYGKYLVLLLFVLVLPMTIRVFSGAGGDPWFCKAICPAGTLFAGWPLVLIHGGGHFQTGFLFTWKSAVLVLILLWSVSSKRPFCRVLCPLGALWGLAGKASVFRMRVGDDCIECDRCRSVCPMDISIYRDADSAECIRCGQCVPACPAGAIRHIVGRVQTRKDSAT